MLRMAGWLVKPGGHSVQLWLFILVGSLTQQGDLHWNYPAMSAEIWLQIPIPRMGRSVAVFCFQIYLIFFLAILGL